MRLLLDTHTFLWFVAGAEELSESARTTLEDADNERFLSIASVWEMAIKASLGKLTLGLPLIDLVQGGAVDNGIALLPIELSHAAAVVDAPWHHRDPFDRLLIAQARTEGLTIVGRDVVFDLYGVSRHW